MSAGRKSERYLAKLIILEILATNQFDLIVFVSE
jgi:hypothetical protein